MKELRKSSEKKIWDLIALLDIEKINQEQLNQNGITRIWGETKNADPLKRDLRIAESMVFNEFKQKEFEKAYERHITTNLFTPPPKTSQSVIINSLLQVLQGVPSDLFKLDLNTLKF